MLSWVEPLKVRLLVKYNWGLSKARYLESLRLFSATEADSAWQLLYAADRVADPAQRADLFGQVLEETSHAEMFKRLYNEASPRQLVPAQYEREALYWDKDDMWRFFVYCWVGEQDAADRFTHIRNATDDPRLAETLDRILADEVGHVHGAQELLKELGITPEQLKGERRRIRLRRAWESWLRTGRTLSDAASTALLSAVYYLVGPLAARAARGRFSRSRTAQPAAADWS